MLGPFVREKLGRLWRVLREETLEETLFEIGEL
jgi:hypothetical protein